MKKIGLLSDTHNIWDEKYEKYFSSCDEIWHAGDIGSLELANKFEDFKPFRAVHGNIDDSSTRRIYPEVLRFSLENVDVLMTHIGGYPGRYEPKIRQELFTNPPKLFISGHSHILKVMRDEKLNNMIVFNPGAAGIHGMHKIKTVLRFQLHEKKVLNLEVIELGKRGKIDNNNEEMA